MMNFKDNLNEGNMIYQVNSLIGHLYMPIKLIKLIDRFRNLV